MFRGCCFCDCFGGIQNNIRYDQPLDLQTVNRCMEAVRAHEREEKIKNAESGHWVRILTYTVIFWPNNSTLVPR